MNDLAARHKHEMATEKEKTIQVNIHYTEIYQTFPDMTEY